MTVKMTKRDKLLVYIMVIVLVVFGFIWFVIFPQIELSGTLDSTMNDLEGKKLPMEAAVMSLDSMKNTYEESIVDLDGALNDFFTRICRTMKLIRCLPGFWLTATALRSPTYP